MCEKWTQECEKWTQAINKIDKQSKPIKITFTVGNKKAKIREEKCKYKDNTMMCYRRGNQSLRRKTSSPPSKQ